MGKLLALFILVPLMDFFLLTQLGAWMGFWNTVALVIVTGMLGAWLTRLEGARAWREAQEAMARGQLPEQGILGGVLLLLGSALLITPGVITDVVGLLLLVPQSRRFIARMIRPYIESRIQTKQQAVAESFVSEPLRVVRMGGVGSDIRGGGMRSRPAPASEGEVIRRRPRAIIDVEYEVTKP